MLFDYLSLEGLALQLCLPKSYLKKLVDAGRLPYLDTGSGRLRFQESSVRKVLLKIEQESLRCRRMDEV